MASHGTVFVRAERHVSGIATILTSTACEWFLIFLLLIDSVFSFLVTKFAHYCELQIPCILCSRLDHVLGNEKPEFYRNLLCNGHKSEISSLVSCQKHGKLAVGHSMCDDCLLSFSTKCHSNPDTQKLFLGKLGFDPIGFGSPGLMPNGDFTISSRWCSCCSKPWKSGRNVRFIQQKSPATRVTKSNIPLPHRVNLQEGMNKFRSKSCDSAVTPHRVGKSSSDPLAHVGYSELKTASDSEIMFSKEDNVSSVLRNINESKDDFGKPRHMKSLTHDASNWYGLSEHSWPNLKTCSLPELIVLEDFSLRAYTSGVSGSVSPVSHILNPSTSTEPLSLADMSPSRGYLGAPVGASQENSNASGKTDTSDVVINEHEERPKLLNTTAIAIKHDLLHDSCAPVEPIYEDSTGASKLALCGKGGDTSEFVAQEPIEKEVYKVKNTQNMLPPRRASTQRNNLSDNSPSANVQGCDSSFFVAEEPKEIDRVGDALNLLLAQNSSTRGISLSDNNKSANVQGGESSGFAVEEPMEKEIDRAGDTLNLSLAQNSSFKGNNLSESYVDSQGCGDERQISTDVAHKGFQTPKESVLVERTESIGFESLDGSTVSEIEGESTIERLKRQVEYDRRCMNELYKELDEERSAATTAANEAMAMITRLQEEKSALHMDALQYLRMMEEQAEYDMDELGKANDLVAEKEKQIQDLEAELEYYWFKYPNESMMGMIPEENLKKENGESMSSSDHIKDDADVLSYSTNSEVSKRIIKHDVLKSSLSDFCDEKLYIVQCLERLERKLQIFAHDMSYGGCNDEPADTLHNQGEVCATNGSLLSCHVEDNGCPLRKDAVSNGTLHVQDGLNASVGVDQVLREENHSVLKGRKSFTECRKIDVVSLENEISDLNERLEALEEDYNILEHTSDLLQNGTEGLLFVQEIARRLQEIRDIGIRCRCHSIP